MSARRIWLAIIMAFIVTGCIPERYQWSPDGRWMTLLTGHGLRIADANGKLTDINIPDALVASWFPDSKRLLVGKQTTYGTWNELSKNLTPEQVKAITDAARRARAAAIVYQWNGPDKTDWNTFKNSFMNAEAEAGRDAEVYLDLGGAVGIYLREHDDQGQLKKALPAERWQELQQLNQQISCVDVYAVDASGAKIGDRLMANLVQSPCEMRVSPTGTAAVVVIQHAQDARPKLDQLWVVPTDGTKPAVQISGLAAWYPDWSPDGQYVAYAEAKAGQADDQWLGTISRLRVVDSDGKLIDKPGGGEQLAGLIGNEFTRVRYLKDGRIIFASVQENLPATPNDVSQRAELFSIWPGKQATVSRLLTRQAIEEIGDCAQYFEVSPDGMHVSIPDQEGKVSVVDMASGSVTEVQPIEIPARNQQGGPSLPSVPTWRSNDELTFVAPDGSQHLRVVLWSLSNSSGKTLSNTWPPEIMQEMERQPTSSPATQSVH